MYLEFSEIGKIFLLIGESVCSTGDFFTEMQAIRKKSSSAAALGLMIFTLLGLFFGVGMGGLLSFIIAFAIYITWGKMMAIIIGLIAFMVISISAGLTFGSKFASYVINAQVNVIEATCPDFLKEKSLLPYRNAKCIQYHHFSMARVKEALQRALTSLNPKIKISDKDSLIKAYTPLNMRTYGEILTIQVTENNSTITITIKSKPKMPLTLADYGQNYINTHFVIDYLKSELGEPV